MGSFSFHLFTSRCIISTRMFCSLSLSLMSKECNQQQHSLKNSPRTTWPWKEVTLQERTIRRTRPLISYPLVHQSPFAFGSQDPPTRNISHLITSLATWGKEQDEVACLASRYWISIEHRAFRALSSRLFEHPDSIARSVGEAPDSLLLAPFRTAWGWEWMCLARVLDITFKIIILAQKRWFGLFCDAFHCSPSIRVQWSMVEALGG